MEHFQPDINFDKLLKIASKGDIEKIKSALEKDADLLNKFSEGHNRSLVWEAVNGNREELVKYLVGQGADVNIPGRYRSRTYVLLKPYCIAHRNKKEALQKYLRAHGHQDDIFSLSYLGGKEEILKHVEKKKELIHQYQREDKLWKVTPLHFAIAGNNIAAMKILLELGAQVKEHSKLLYEIACRNERIDIIKELTRYGGVPNQVDVFSVFYHNNDDIIEYFVKMGLDCDKEYVHGWPPIAYLCRGDKGEHPEKVEKLLQYVKDINAQTPKGISALHCASKAGFSKVVKLLVEKGVEINIRDHRGKTPLHYSRKYKRLEVENYLANNGAIE